MQLSQLNANVSRPRTSDHRLGESKINRISAGPNQRKGIYIEQLKSLFLHQDVLVLNDLLLSQLSHAAFVLMEDAGS